MITIPQPTLIPLKIQAKSYLPTDFGDFEMLAFSVTDENWMPHLALVAKGTDLNATVNVRFHSECVTGEIFHSSKCECGAQLDEAMAYFQKHGGVLIYLRQEGRGIGLINKIRAYQLQQQGLDTIEANLHLGLPIDNRDFTIGITMLELLGIKKVNLLTNNPEKMRIFERSTISLMNRIPLEIKANKHSEGYLSVKKKQMGHLLKEVV